MCKIKKFLKLKSIFLYKLCSSKWLCPETIARRCSILNVFLKVSQSHRKIPVLESLFHKVAGLQYAILLLEKKLRHRCFPVNFVRFLWIPLWRNTLDDCFCLLITKKGKTSWKSERFLHFVWPSAKKYKEKDAMKSTLRKSND